MPLYGMLQVSIECNKKEFKGEKIIVGVCGKNEKLD